MTDVLVIAGSRSDEKIVEKVTKTLEKLDISYSVEFASAHREPERVKSLIEESEARVIIAIAGLAAALPGYVASLTSRPVIGVPVSAALGGLDALLSIAQMPKGVPVATVGIDNGQNAAFLAARILALTDEGVTGPPPRTYAEAGVDESEVAAGLEVLSRYVRQSFSGHDVPVEFGHFANLVRVGDGLYVALSTDGVGSKVLIAEMVGRFDTIAQDCVAMNVNDLICIGATPVGFVDYLACARPLPRTVLEQIGQGLRDACRTAGVPILGGETAILPDIIRGHGDTALDLAGTAVGVAREDEVIDGRAIEPGDAIIGIESNGLHSNGFTLVRKALLATHSLEEKTNWGRTLGEELLRPTTIYVPHFKRLKEAGIEIHGLAHITGSAFRKILRLGDFHFRLDEMPLPPPIFDLVRKEGNIEWEEMFTTFNMGVGLVVVVPEDAEEEAIDALRPLGGAQRVGVVETSGKGRVTIKRFEVVIE